MTTRKAPGHLFDALCFVAIAAGLWWLLSIVEPGRSSEAMLVADTAPDGGR